MGQVSDNEVRWHCRRGMLELDMLLHGYFDAKYAGLSTAQQRTFVGLLTWLDQDLWRCLFANEQALQSCDQAMLEDMVSYHKSTLAL